MYFKTLKKESDLKIGVVIKNTTENKTYGIIKSIKKIERPHYNVFDVILTKVYEENNRKINHISGLVISTGITPHVTYYWAVGSSYFKNINYKFLND